MSPIAKALAREQEQNAVLVAITRELRAQLAEAQTRLAQREQILQAKIDRLTAQLVELENPQRLTPPRP